MKQWQLKSDEPRLQIMEVEQPVAGAGQVLVRMCAASLNYRDLLIGHGQPPVENGCVPLSDGAGEIVGIGLDIPGQSGENWQIGERVASTFFRDWQSGRFDNRYHQAALGGSVDGVLSEYQVFSAHGLVRVPEHFSYAEAATMPCAGLTAWCALQRGGFRGGDSVLLLGTGGVSIWGLQLVVALGGRAIITSSSDEKLARARELGAHATINYRAMPDWDKEVWRLTNKRGVDHILEVGGPDTLGKSVNCVAAGGHIAQIGVLSGFGAPQSSLFPLVSKNATMSGIYVGSRESLEQLVRCIESVQLRPIIDRSFAFADAPEAYKYMESGAHLGKVVIEVGDYSGFE